MQQSRECAEWQRYGRMLALRPARGQQLRKRRRGRRGQRYAVQLDLLGGRVGHIRRLGRPRIGRGDVEAPFRRRPPTGCPARHRRARGFGQAGPAQRRGQRLGARCVPGREDRAQPGPRRQFGNDRRAAGGQPRAAFLTADWLQRGIGREAPCALRHRSAPPAGPRARGAETRRLARAEPDTEFRQPRAEQRQRQLGGPERVRQLGRIAVGEDRHARAERIQRPRRADEWPPGDLTQRAEEPEPAIGARARRRRAGEQAEHRCAWLDLLRECGLHAVSGVSLGCGRPAGRRSRHVFTQCDTRLVVQNLPSGEVRAVPDRGPVAPSLSSAGSSETEPGEPIRRDRCARCHEPR